MEECKLTGTREHMDKVADLVATAMGVARLIGKPKVREKYLGGANVSLLLLGKILEESALEVEAIIDWDDIEAAWMTRVGEAAVHETDGAACKECADSSGADEMVSLNKAGCREASCRHVEG